MFSEAMTKWLDSGRIINKWTRLYVLAACFGVGYAAHAEIHKIGKFDAGPQIVFTVNQTLPTGEWVLIAPEVVPVLTVHGAEHHMAPLEPGTKKICRMLYEYRDSEGQKALAFSCGIDEVVTTTSIELLNRKEAKKYVGEDIPRSR